MEKQLTQVTQENQTLREENQFLKGEIQKLRKEIDNAHRLAKLAEEEDDFDDKLRTLFEKNQAQKELVKMQKGWDRVQETVEARVATIVQRSMPALLQGVEAVANWREVKILEPPVAGRKGGGGGGYSDKRRFSLKVRERILDAKEDKQNVLQLKLKDLLKQIGEWAKFKPEPPKVKGDVLWGMEMTEWVNGIKAITRFVVGLRDALGPEEVVADIRNCLTAGLSSGTFRTVEWAKLGEEAVRVCTSSVGEPLRMLADLAWCIRTARLERFTSPKQQTEILNALAAAACVRSVGARSTDALRMQRARLLGLGRARAEFHWLRVITDRVACDQIPGITQDELAKFATPPGKQRGPNNSILCVLKDLLHSCSRDGACRGWEPVLWRVYLALETCVQTLQPRDFRACKCEEATCCGGDEANLTVSPTQLVIPQCALVNMSGGGVLAVASDGDDVTINLKELQRPADRRFTIFDALVVSQRKAGLVEEGGGNLIAVVFVGFVRISPF